MALGLFLSAFARSELQAVPAFVLPQILLRLILSREEMADWLQRVAALMPFAYAYDALDRAASGPELGVRLWADVAVLMGVPLLALVLGATALRRRIA